jgi:2-dehydro-3-deoxygluconokinase
MPEKKLDLVALGEALIEMSRVGETTYSLSCAGDVLNTLFYASRLGLRSGLITATGQDIFEQHLLALFKEEHIEASHVMSLPAKKNGVYFIHLHQDGEPEFHFFRKDSAATETLVRHNLEDLHRYVVSARAFLFSAIGLAVYKERERVASLLMRIKGETRIYFDTNFRASLWEDPKHLRNLIQDLAGFIDVIFVTNTDDRALFGERPREKALEYYRALGIPTVIFREGKAGASCSSGDAIHHVGAVKEITVVDTTAAGDAFNAGFIAKQLGGASNFEALTYGCATAAQVIQHAGGIVSTFQKTLTEKYFAELMEAAA